MEYNQVQKNLRKKFHKEAKETIRQVEKQDDILSAILTGSAAWGKPNPDGDLDILLVTQNQKSVFYRYLIPTFCPVQRRTELGYIPHEVVINHIENGYGNLISCSMVEQLKNGRVLFQKDNQGDDLIESCQRVLPSKLVIGKLISDICKVFKELEENLSQNRVKEATLAIRQVARLSVQALLLVREKTGVAKEKHEYRAVRDRLSKRETESYEKLTGVKGITEEKARRIVEKTINLVRWVLEGCSISPGLVDYEGKK